MPRCGLISTLNLGVSMYIKEEYRTKGGRLVLEYHSPGARPPNEKRGERRKATPEEIQRNNLLAKQRKAKLLILENFSPGDYHSILTFTPENRPDGEEECKRLFKNFRDRMKRAYRKEGHEMKWIANIEVGSRGAWHIHLIINRIPGTDVLLDRNWPYGRPRNIIIRDPGGMVPLAAYVSKESRIRSPDGGERKLNGFSHSRNLKMPKAKKKIMKRWETWKPDVRVPKGYSLLKDSLDEWIGRDGYPHREYVLLPEVRRRI